MPSTEGCGVDETARFHHASCGAAARAVRGGEMRSAGPRAADWRADGVCRERPEGQACVAAFRDELQKLGWREGRNIRIDIRWATPGDAEATQRFAKELVALQPDLILSANTPTTAALLQQTRTIPIVFATVADPVGSGFVASFPRPGGNVTGLSRMMSRHCQQVAGAAQGDCAARQPGCMPVQPGNGAIRRIFSESLHGRCRVLRSGGDRSPCSRHVRTRIRHCRTGTRAEWRPDRDAGYLHGRPSRGDHIAGGSLPVSLRSIRTVTSLKLAACCPTEMTRSIIYRRAAIYADRILKGIKPSELPVQAPVKFEMVVNPKTAKALGLDVPMSFSSAPTR